MAAERPAVRSVIDRSLIPWDPCYGDFRTPPADGHRLLIGSAPWMPRVITSHCPHKFAELDPYLAMDAAMDAVRSIDGCPLVEVWLCFSPAAHALECLGGNAEMDAKLREFLAAKQDELACGCDPDLRLAYGAPFPASYVVVSLEHETWCPRARRAAERAS